MNPRVEFGTIVVCDLNATDPSGLDEWWVDDTLHFTVDDNGRIHTIGFLVPGAYLLTVYVNDTFDNTLWISLTVNVQDTTPPMWVTEVTNQYLEYGVHLSYQLLATDFSGIASWDLNDTANFRISENGLLTSRITLIPGKYNLLVSVSDPYGNELSAVFSIFVTAETTTTSTITTNTQTTTTSTSTTSSGPQDSDTMIVVIIGIGAGGGVMIIIIVIILRKKRSG